MSVSDAVKKLFSLEGSLPEGVKPCQFDQTVEVSMHLGVDPKQADQLVRGSIVLPHGTGRVSRVLVFAEGELAEAATEAGADYVGAADLAVWRLCGRYGHATISDRRESALFEE